MKIFLLAATISLFFLSLSNNLFATTISDTANGNIDGWINVTDPNTITNGDFLITGNDIATVVGNGVDEYTTWTFDFTSDTNYNNIILDSVDLTSAWLELTLTPLSTLITTDSVKIVGLPSIETTIQSLSVGATAIIEFELLDFYSSADILTSFSTGALGAIDMLYQDDAIVSSATLTLSNNPVPEPTTMLLFGTGLIGLAGFSWRKKK